MFDEICFENVEWVLVSDDRFQRQTFLVHGDETSGAMKGRECPE
jgi:hypothetical protein